MAECCLEGEQQEAVTNLLSKWISIFSKGLTGLGCTDSTVHEIHLADNEPFKEP